MIQITIISLTLYGLSSAQLSAQPNWRSQPVQPVPLPFTHIPPVEILESTTTTTTTTAAPTPTTTAAPPMGYVYGAYGQLCPATNNRRLCKSTTDYAMDASGILDCDITAGCCLCTAIYCGYSGAGCREVTFGNYGATFVSLVYIAGDPSSGAVISCNGVESCLGATITATNVAAIDCDAARACQYAKIRITDPVQNFVIECGGVNSCDGMEIEINFTGAPAGYQCAYIGNPSYVKPVWQLEGIECGASGACNLLDITINNEIGCRSISLGLVDCQERNSCNGAVFDFIGDVTIARCACGTSCSSAVGLESCYNPNPNLYNPHLYNNQL